MSSIFRIIEADRRRAPHQAAQRYSSLQDGQKDWGKITVRNLGQSLVRAYSERWYLQNARSDFYGQFGLGRRACSVVTYSHRRIINRIPLFSYCRADLIFGFIFLGDFTTHYSPSSRCHRQRVGNIAIRIATTHPYYRIVTSPGHAFLKRASLARSALPTAIHLGWAPSQVLRDAHDWLVVLRASLV